MNPIHSTPILAFKTNVASIPADAATVPHSSIHLAKTPDGRRSRAEGHHGFLPIKALADVHDGSSTITVTSPSGYALELLVRIGSRAFLVELVPNTEGS